MAQRTPAVRGRWTLIGLLTTATFINYLDRGSLAVALPVMSRELGLGPAEQGIALSAFFWTYTAMQIPMGRLVDRFSIKRLYTVCFALWSLAAAGGVLAPAITGIVVARTGSYVPAFLTVSAILVVGIGAYTLIVPPLSAERSQRPA